MQCPLMVLSRLSGLLPRVLGSSFTSLSPSLGAANGGRSLRRQRYPASCSSARPGRHWPPASGRHVARSVGTGAPPWYRRARVRVFHAIAIISNTPKCVNKRKPRAGQLRRSPCLLAQTRVMERAGGRMDAREGRQTLRNTFEIPDGWLQVIWGYGAGSFDRLRGRLKDARQAQNNPA